MSVTKLLTKAAIEQQFKEKHTHALTDVMLIWQSTITIQWTENKKKLYG